MNLPNFPTVDLFSAGVNALNGVLVAGNPEHNRGYTFAGLLIMGFFGGIGGGVTRDVLLNKVPAPLSDPRYSYVCVLMALVGLAIYHYAKTMEESFHARLREYFKSFTLPWFAILGAHKALEQNLGLAGAILVGLAATTAGGVFIDLFSGVTPVIVRADEQHATTAVLASTVYSLIALHFKNSNSFFPVTLIAVAVGFTFRVFAVRGHWASIIPIGSPPRGIQAIPTANNPAPRA
jgi:uncharacterized membrane protein YeiH